MFIVVAESRTSEVLQTNNIVAAVRALSSIFLKYFVDDDSKKLSIESQPTPYVYRHHQSIEYMIYITR